MIPIRLTKGEQGHFSIEGDLNRESLVRCPKDLIALSHNLNDTHIVIDMQGIKDVDTAGLAWTLNLLKSYHQLNIRWTLKHIPQSLVNLAKISDADSFLSVQ